MFGVFGRVGQGKIGGPRDTNGGDEGLRENVSWLFVSEKPERIEIGGLPAGTAPASGGS